MSIADSRGAGSIVFGQVNPDVSSNPGHGLQPSKPRRDPGPTPEQRRSMFEALEPGSQIVPAAPLNDIVQASIAISLKRIADHFENQESLKRIADHLEAQRRLDDELHREISR